MTEGDILVAARRAVATQPTSMRRLIEKRKVAPVEPAGATVLEAAARHTFSP